MWGPEPSLPSRASRALSIAEAPSALPPGCPRFCSPACPDRTPPSPPTLLLLTLPNLASRTPPSFTQGETWEALYCLPLLRPSPLSLLAQPARWPWLPWALGRLLQMPPYNLPFAPSQGQLFKNVTASPPCWKPSGSFPCLQDQDARAWVLTSGIQQPEEPSALILQLTAPNSIPCPLAQLIPSVLSRDDPLEEARQPPM